MRAEMSLARVSADFSLMKIAVMPDDGSSLEGRKPDLIANQSEEPAARNSEKT
jgi:hypothetical protein